MSSEPIPNYLIVAAAGEFKPGFAVRLKFGMRRKKHFSFIAFIYESPITLTKAALLEKFDQIRNAFLMDYADPREDFNGKIEVENLSSAEIRAAIKNCRDYGIEMSFPVGYLQSLEAALRINPEIDCLVAFEKLY